MRTMTEQPAPETAPQPEGFVCPHCKRDMEAAELRKKSTAIHGFGATA